MATSESSITPVQAARQQLDELDSLLQRMLALPISHGANGQPANGPVANGPTVHEAPAPLENRSGETASVAGATAVAEPEEQSLAFPEELVAEEEEIPLSSAPGVTIEETAAEETTAKLEVKIINSAAPLKETYLAAQDKQNDATPPSDRLAMAATEERALDHEPTLTYMPEAPGQPSALGRCAKVPAIWLNQGFDQATRLSGPLGHGLRSGGGRRAIGLLGLLLVGSALAGGVMRFMGWTW